MTDPSAIGAGMIDHDAIAVEMAPSIYPSSFARGPRSFITSTGAELTIAPPGSPPVSPAVSPAAAPAPLSATNPFANLPFPNPGDRIKAEDFRRLSQCLDVIQQLAALSAALLGRTLADAKLALAAQQFTIERVMSVFGREVTGAADATLDGRKVVQVLPAALGERRLHLVVTEAVEVRRLTPNLLNLTYTEAMERLRGALGEAPIPSTSMRSPQFVGRTLAEAARELTTSSR